MRLTPMPKRVTSNTTLHEYGLPLVVVEATKKEASHRIPCSNGVSSKLIRISAIGPDVRSVDWRISVNVGSVLSLRRHSEPIFSFF